MMLHDEQGKASTSRSLLIIVVLFTLALIAADSFAADVPTDAYAVLTAYALGLISWAAGRGIAQYLAPQIGAIAGGLAARLRKDDE